MCFYITFSTSCLLVRSLEPEGTAAVHPPGLTAAEGLPGSEGAVRGWGVSLERTILDLTSSRTWREAFTLLELQFLIKTRAGVDESRDSFLSYY